MRSLRCWKPFCLLLLVNLIQFPLLAQNDSSLFLAKELSKITDIDLTLTQTSRNASSRLIRLISPNDLPLDPSDLFEKHRQHQIEALAQQYTAKQLKDLISTYQNPLMNRFLKKYHTLVLIDATSILPLYVFQENVRIFKDNKGLTNDQKKPYLKLTHLSSSQVHAKEIAPILRSEYYQSLIYCENENIHSASVDLINSIYKNVYQKDKVALAKSNYEEILTIMSGFGFINVDHDIKNIVKLSSDNFYFERNLEKEFTPSEIKEIQARLQDAPINLHFLTLPHKIAALMNGSLRSVLKPTTPKDEHHLVMASSAPIFKYVTP